MKSQKTVTMDELSRKDLGVGQIVRDKAFIVSGPDFKNWYEVDNYSTALSTFREMACKGKDAILAFGVVEYLLNDQAVFKVKDSIILSHSGAYNAKNNINFDDLNKRDFCDVLDKLRDSFGSLSSKAVLEMKDTRSYGEHFAKEMIVKRVLIVGSDSDFVFFCRESTPNDIINRYKKVIDEGHAASILFGEVLLSFDGNGMPKTDDFKVQGGIQLLLMVL